MTGGISGHTRPYRGLNDEWLTPPEILEALGPFDLDPAAPVDRPWPMAKDHLTVLDNGLTHPWNGRVWLNPPYGPQTGHWLERLARHGCGTALIFARTETEMFFRWVWGHATALLFLEGRLHFYTPTGQRAPHNSGGPSVLIAYGVDDAARLRNAAIAGAFVSVWDRVTR